MDTDLARYLITYALLCSYGALALRHRSHRWRLIAALVMTAGVVGSVLLVLREVFFYGVVLVVCGIPAFLFGDQNDVDGALDWASTSLREPLFLLNAAATILLFALMISHYRAWRRLRPAKHEN